MQTSASLHTAGMVIESQTPTSVIRFNALLKTPAGTVYAVIRDSMENQYIKEFTYTAEDRQFDVDFADAIPAGFLQSGRNFIVNFFADLAQPPIEIDMIARSHGIFVRTVDDTAGAQTQTIGIDFTCPAGDDPGGDLNPPDPS